MIVIADTSPLIALAKLNILTNLKTVYGRIVITEIVKAELSAIEFGDGVPDVLATIADWCDVRDPETLTRFTGLDDGESSAMSLALEGSTVLLIDEHRGRTVAESFGIPILGTVGLLLLFAIRGLLNLSDAFKSLKTTNFRFPPAKLDEILADFLNRPNADGPPA